MSQQGTAAGLGGAPHQHSKGTNGGCPTVLADCVGNRYNGMPDVRRILNAIRINSAEHAQQGVTGDPHCPSDTAYIAASPHAAESHRSQYARQVAYGNGRGAPPHSGTIICECPNGGCASGETHRSDVGPCRSLRCARRHPLSPPDARLAQLMPAIRAAMRIRAIFASCVRQRGPPAVGAAHT